MKQSSLDDHDSINMELDAFCDHMREMSEFDELHPPDNSDNQMSTIYSNRSASPLNDNVAIPRGLPWKPKVRQKDIDLFLDTARVKFVGYSLQGDRATLAGLPIPIHEGVKTLKEVISLLYLFKISGVNFFFNNASLSPLHLPF